MASIENNLEYINFYSMDSILESQEQHTHNPQSNLIKFDIDFYKLEDVPTNLYGGGFGDDTIILYYISHLIYNNILSRNSSDQKQYHFTIADQKYNNNRKGLFIGNGFYSTVIAIECKYPTDKHIEEILVLKLLLIKKDRTMQYINAWNYRFYTKYDKDKLLYNNLIATCYYYGDNVNIINSTLETDNTEQDIKVKKIFQNKKLVFNIFKYYGSIDSIVNNLYIKQTILLKMFAILYYCRCHNTYIYDFKWENVGYDTNYNIILYDYSEHLLNNYIKDEEYILWKQTVLTITTACYFRKLIYLKLKLNNPDTFTYINREFDRTIQFRSDDYDQQTNNIINTNIIIYKLLKKNSMVNDYGSYYSINFNPLFDKLNSLSSINIILSLFFSKISISSLSFSDTIFEYNHTQIKLNKFLHKYPYNWTMIMYICGFHNLNDINILDILVNQMLVGLDGIDPAFIQGILYLLFDALTEFGIFAPDYENIPIYELILKYLKDLTMNSELIHVLLKELLDQNIGTPSVIEKTPDNYDRELNSGFIITNIGNDVRDKLIDLGLLNIDFRSTIYWQCGFARLVEQLIDRSDNRTYSNIKLPPTNSTLPQSSFIVFDTRTGNKIIINKWIEHPHIRNRFIINEEYTTALDNISKGLYIPYISTRQQFLDESPIRRNAKYVVKLINNPSLPMPPPQSSLSNRDVNILWEETKSCEEYITFIIERVFSAIPNMLIYQIMRPGIFDISKLNLFKVDISTPIGVALQNFVGDTYREFSISDKSELAEWINEIQTKQKIPLPQSFTISNPELMKYIANIQEKQKADKETKKQEKSGLHDIKSIKLYNETRTEGDTNILKERQKGKQKQTEKSRTILRKTEEDQKRLQQGISYKYLKYKDKYLKLKNELNL